MTMNIEIDFTDQIKQLRASCGKGCECGTDCSCGGNCGESCECDCHESTEAEHKSGKPVSEYKNANEEKNECPEGKAWDKKLKKCMPVKKDEAKHKEGKGPKSMYSEEDKKNGKNGKKGKNDKNGKDDKKNGKKEKKEKGDKKLPPWLNKSKDYSELYKKLRGKQNDA
jgi:hypothetical protein